MNQQEKLVQRVVEAKDHGGRQFKHFTNNFYTMKAAIRYFSVKQGKSFNSSKVSDNFPITIPEAGSALNILEQLDVVESRSSSSSPDVYMPRKVDMDKLERVEEVLLESYEIEEFKN